jgi:hypothetical protein
VISDKIKKKYGSLQGTLVVASLERGQHGLGISLAGHKDRNRMAVFVCGLNPNGTASKEGTLKVGDEILEVSLRFQFCLEWPSSAIRFISLIAQDFPRIQLRQLLVRAK